MLQHCPHHTTPRHLPTHLIDFPARGVGVEGAARIPCATFTRQEAPLPRSVLLQPRSEPDPTQPPQGECGGGSVGAVGEAAEATRGTPHQSTHTH
ncbi:hypothetical protein Pmani_018979 [Petrolisthes manimaculis]|uniref:Uncharacterized protein n=1 Tax=Petrolisthes manimaculis TaxID=1843537 RepID=A0AAE1PLN5_9EUCA|nr:hypothetical protein Pmani_018979 [Petrolisthes manimaculis]